MGTPALQSLSNVLPQEIYDLFHQLPSFSPSAPSDVGVPSSYTAPAAVSAPNQEQTVDEAYNASVYRSQTQQISLSMKMQEVAAKLLTDETGATESTSFQAQQLEFSFFSETRTEELIQFQQRNAQVAEGLEGARQSRFIQTSQEVAMRFEFSFSISGEALTGYNNAAEAFQDREEVMDQFMAFAQEFLSMADDFFNEAFSLFSGSSLEDATLGFQDMMDALTEEFLSGFFGDSGVNSTAPASQQHASFSMQMEFSFSFSGSVTIEQAEVQESDPIILDLDGDGYEMTSYKNGAQFDILGSGSKQQTAFVTGGDAFLAIDRNGDGEINSGKELFGDQHGASNGFEELRKMDSNGDGVISKLDAGFDDLLLFKDNGNGKTEAGELISLAQAGIESIDLGYKNVDELSSGGNHLGQLSSFLRSDGTTGKAADAILNYIA